MPFRVYKPKDLRRVKAEQVTVDTIRDLADRLMGRVVLPLAGKDGTKTNTPIGLDVPTFDGVKHFEVGCWVIRNDDNTLGKLTDEEFTAQYELAVNRGTD